MSKIEKKWQVLYVPLPLLPQVLPVIAAIQIILPVYLMTYMICI